uniref:Uncharacterized protein n=1 Tax=Anguilla anguilla TaxID=7936 RepID=A0A0E9V3P2_ANGAN
MWAHSLCLCSSRCHMPGMIRTVPAASRGLQFLFTA